MSTSQSSPPFSKSADSNKDVILEQLKLCLKPGDILLEVASGTGQHAIHFSRAMPDVVWQASDRDLDAFGLQTTLSTGVIRENLLPPVVLDIARWSALCDTYDVVYSANCLHVIPQELVELYVAGAAASLKAGGLMLLYGPFKYGGDFTTASNRDFDVFLRETYPGGGIRDFEWIDELAIANGLQFESDTAMPANNQFLIWRKVPKP